MLSARLLIGPFFIKLAKLVNSPVDQNAKIVAVNTEIATNFIVIAILKKTCLQKMAVSFRKGGQNRADMFAILLALHKFFQPQLFIGNFSKFQRFMVIAGVIATAFRKNVLANGVYVSAETAGVIHAASLHGHKHATEGFLPHIFNCVRVNTASAQSDSQAFTEVRDKMCLGRWIARTKPTKIFIIKSVEVHGRSFTPVYFSLCC